MKITNFAIIFILILGPFWFSLQVKGNQIEKSDQLSNRYDQALTISVDDAAKSLLTNVKQDFESGYGSDKNTSANRTEAFNTFFKTLSLNFNVENPNGLGVLQAYIPVMAIVDYKGIYIYAMDEYKNAENVLIREHVEMPMKPYVYKDDQGNMISFTLDDYVIAYDKAQDKWNEGFREEIKDSLSIPLLQNAELFENVRRTTILNVVQDEIEYYINRHNTYAKRLGVTYRFTMPVLSGEDWQNTIDDIGVISFVQGYPLGGGDTYNNYALGGSRIIKQHDYYGTVIDGIKYYYRDDEGYSYPVDEVFPNEKEAVKKGYFPLD
ncbi:hypothetical protein [Bacillus sp. AFS040349]|uniref:hypothetical protein n=1 Tax=Bacillus sp. AFS040349 TaxID=2033502 RepID=UPI000BFD06D3|nr:hypothetical protein [Bacillus sp. AFS040349]PGT83233.1 hypothetical protein COD11_12930 [Bacillus sp. AFS040349]